MLLGSPVLHLERRYSVDDRGDAGGRLALHAGAILPWPKNSIRAAIAMALALSMAGGMNWGAALVLRWAGPGHPWQFLIAYGGMTLGMLSGMLFVCAFTEALRHHLRIGPSAPRRESAVF